MALDVDVVIVGGGAGGLALGRALALEGVAALILEARGTCAPRRGGNCSNPTAFVSWRSWASSTVCWRRGPR
ncbi:MAG: hypothetical protein DIU69_01470 [Bacillota bacterium]|nr:MAG: hypothetical protein DIU69_01470 [Bacillota bacterium]